MLVALYAGGWVVNLAGMGWAGVALTWAGVSAVWWGLRLTHLEQAAHRRYAAACLAAAGLWLAWSSTGSPAGREFWLLLAWTAGAWAWWVPGRHWPDDWAPAPPAPPAPVLPPADDLVSRWERFVGNDNGPLPGSRVIDHAVTEVSDDLTVQVVPGKQTAATAMEKTDLISSGLDEPQELLVVEPHPQPWAEKKRPTVVRVQVLRHSPLEEVRYFRGPRFRDGRVVLGNYIDGVGEAEWEIFNLLKRRIRNGVLFGGTGVGKTRITEQIAVTIRSPEWQARWPTMIVYLDGQDGASSRLLWDHAKVRGGPADAPAILAGLRRMSAARRQWNKVYGAHDFLPGWSPEPGVQPLTAVVVFVDECHAIFRKPEGAKWSDPAREDNKVGVGLHAFDQITDLEAFGDSEALRSSLLAGNGGMMHIDSKTAGGNIPGAPDPYTIPKIPGYMHKIGGGRQAPLRCDYMPSAEDKAVDPSIPDDVLTVEEWFASGSEAELDAMSAREFGDPYLRRREHAELKKQQARAVVEGRVPAERERINATGPARAADQAPAPDAASPLAAVPDPQPTEQDVATTYEVAVAYLREHGPAQRKDIVDHVDKQVGTGIWAVRAALRKAARSGVVKRGPAGWTYTGKARQDQTLTGTE